MSKKIRNHGVQKIVCNEDVEIRVENRIKTNGEIQCNKPDLFIHDKRKNLITLIEVGITSQDNLQTVETEKLRMYDILDNELRSIYKCKVEIIPFVLTWDGVITKYHSMYVKKLRKYDFLANELSLIYKCKVEIIPFVLTSISVITKYHSMYDNKLSIPPKIQAYIQIIVLKKTLESIFLDFRRGLQEECKKKDLSDIAITLMEKKEGTDSNTAEKERNIRFKLTHK
ncbi:hypothetical protein NUSPORA_00448 [Nucleospora cyclopteri]